MLQSAVRELGERARKFRERTLGEENTKASLSDPLLEVLGWDIRDPDEVHREYRPTPKDNPVDYCLRLMRNPRLLIEAKGLGEVLADRKWIAQTLGYATMAGAPSVTFEIDPGLYACPHQPVGSHLAETLRASCSSPAMAG
jgi:hypothetical protein